MIIMDQPAMFHDLRLISDMVSLPWSAGNTNPVLRYRLSQRCTGAMGTQVTEHVQIKYHTESYEIIVAQ